MAVLCVAKIRPKSPISARALFFSGRKPFCARAFMPPAWNICPFRQRQKVATTALLICISARGAQDKRYFRKFQRISAPDPVLRRFFLDFMGGPGQWEPNINLNGFEYARVFLFRCREFCRRGLAMAHDRQKRRRP
ncbi:MAG: hypothetical protein LBQ10_08165 [Desulfovibrio sp.]|nr:hypothetical protein [Desulfovibrio sp.]